ncbi:hypothetical protein Pmani_014258 [Petrolisthes manimaculis]|uniref:Uncharacterized protein n=1 Tax=Petrolisthes manimaculis TaxID=1843537 RepID=A0AAE1UDA0_9EUCA|nr:hypothetical protein Pmani_014258 [Petrolisthes manimaculis]
MVRGGHSTGRLSPQPAKKRHQGHHHPGTEDDTEVVPTQGIGLGRDHDPGTGGGRKTHILPLSPHPGYRPHS